MYSNFWTKKIRYEVDAIIKKKNEKKIYKLIPETKIRANQVVIINNDCPISGWDDKKNTIGIKIKKLKK